MKLAARINAGYPESAAMMVVRGGRPQREASNSILDYDRYHQQLQQGHAAAAAAQEMASCGVQQQQQQQRMAASAGGNNSVVQSDSAAAAIGLQTSSASTTAGASVTASNSSSISAGGGGAFGTGVSSEGFAPDQVACICEALMQSKEMDKLSRFVFLLVIAV